MDRLLTNPSRHVGRVVRVCVEHEDGPRHVLGERLGPAAVVRLAVPRVEVGHRGVDVGRQRLNGRIHVGVVVLGEHDPALLDLAPGPRLMVYRAVPCESRGGGEDDGLEVPLVLEPHDVVDGMGQRRSDRDVTVDTRGVFGLKPVPHLADRRQPFQLARLRVILGAVGHVEGPEVRVPSERLQQGDERVKVELVVRERSVGRVRHDPARVEVEGIRVRAHGHVVATAHDALHLGHERVVNVRTEVGHDPVVVRAGRPDERAVRGTARRGERDDDVDEFVHFGDLGAGRPRVPSPVSVSEPGRRRGVQGEVDGDRAFAPLDADSVDPGLVWCDSERVQRPIEQERQGLPRLGREVGDREGVEVGRGELGRPSEFRRRDRERLRSRVPVDRFLRSCDERGQHREGEKETEHYRSGREGRDDTPFEQERGRTVAAHPP